MWQMKCVQRKKMEKEEKKRRCTSNLGSSSKMGQVANASSLCLDCKGEKKTKDKVKKKSQHVSGVAAGKSKVYKKQSRIRSNLLSAR